MRPGDEERERGRWLDLIDADRKDVDVERGEDFPAIPPRSDGTAAGGNRGFPLLVVAGLEVFVARNERGLELLLQLGCRVEGERLLEVLPRAFISPFWLKTHPRLASGSGLAGSSARARS